jgi:hypothetical protein
MNLFSEIAVSPKELAAAAAQGLIHIDHRTAFGRKIPHVSPAPKFNADVAKETIRMLEGKLAALQKHCEHQERLAYINLTGITTIQSEITAKIEELGTLKTDRTQMVCDAATEAFKEALELLAQHQTRMEGMQ